jgi:bifunctional non-homologous end joining protein LigD
MSEVLPQLSTYSSEQIGSVEWLFEPCWSGDRLMARLRDGRVTLSDGSGEAADTAFAEAARALERMVDADEALIDGIWTEQVSEATPPRPAYVALDLVELDGQALHDVPYLERRRLLESVVQEGHRVRISPVVRMPVSSWLDAWRSNGFDFYFAKHMNSRYRPGEFAEDWLRIPIRQEKAPTPIGRLFGRLGDRPPRGEGDGRRASRGPKRE